MSFEEFLDGHHCDHIGYQNKTILATLNLCHSDAFCQVWAQSEFRYGRCHLKNFKMPPWQPSWISEGNFSNSESLCRTNASHLVSAQSDMILEMSFEEFQYGCDGHLGYQNGTIFSNSDSLCHCDASHQVSVQSDMVWEMLLEEFQDSHNGGHLGYRN